MKKHDVIAEFVDTKTNERHFPAEPGAEPNNFTPHSEEQAKALIAAGCLGEPGAKATPSPSPAPTPTPAAARNRQGS